jgi:hypothetical protein
MVTTTNATQKFVPLRDVRDSVVILEDGNMRGILMASSLNFSLKSGDEKQAILMQFQDFLNSLDFSVQIFVQSRRLDIRPYISLLQERYKDQVNDLMKIQTEQYINFVKSFTESASIMTKSFFVIVPYDAAIINSASGIAGFLPFGPKNGAEEIDLSRFEENKVQLEQRMAGSRTRFGALRHPRRQAWQRRDNGIVLQDVQPR